MHFTDYTTYNGRCDGYYANISYSECLVSLKEGLGPILKCFAVARKDGSYDSIVRDYSTGKMVASRMGIMTHKMAKYMAKKLATLFISSEI